MAEGLIMYLNIIIVCASIFTCVKSTSVYDQSQTGKLNVQVDLKDLNLFAILKGKTKEEYVDYDYAYDYSEMTIKPHGHKNTTTMKPSTGTNSTNTTSSVDSIAMSQQNATANATELTTTDTKTNTTEASMSTTTELTTQSATPKVTVTSNENQNTTVASSSPAPLMAVNSTTHNCRKGFVVNKKGNCELRLLGTTGNALLKLVKLSQKLKLRRENKKE